MANTLKIIKRSDRGFIHRHNDLTASDYSISDFEISIDGDRFKIIEKDGSTRFPYAIADITVIDLTGGGVPETFTTLSALEDRLREIEYTPFIETGAGYGIPEAPVNGQIYGRKNATWVLVETGAKHIRRYLELEIIEKGINEGVPNEADYLEVGDFVAGRKDEFNYWDRAMYIGPDPTNRDDCYVQYSGGGI